MAKEGANLTELSKLCDAVLHWQVLNNIRAAANRHVDWRAVSDILLRELDLDLTADACRRKWKFLAYGEHYSEGVPDADSDVDEGFLQPVQAFELCRSEEDVKEEFERTGKVKVLKRRASSSSCPERNQSSHLATFVPNRIGEDSNSLKSVIHRITSYSPIEPAGVQLPEPDLAQKPAPVAAVPKIKKPKVVKSKVPGGISAVSVPVSVPVAKPDGAVAEPIRSVVTNVPAAPSLPIPASNTVIQGAPIAPKALSVDYAVCIPQTITTTIAIPPLAAAPVTSTTATTWAPSSLPTPQGEVRLSNDKDTASGAQSANLMFWKYGVKYADDKTSAVDESFPTDADGHSQQEQQWVSSVEGGDSARAI